jgi:hypothetical protein
VKATEQEKLFAKVKARFPGWSNRQCSGYVAGVVDCDRGRPPDDDVDTTGGYDETYRDGYTDALDPAISAFSVFPEIQSYTYLGRWWDAD